MTSKPFTNAIAVGSEGAGHVWNALTQITDATLLARLAVRGFETNPDRMRERAEAGYVTATACADALAGQGTMSFRQAHRMIGRLVNEAIARGGVPLAEVAGAISTGPRLPADLSPPAPTSAGAREPIPWLPFSWPWKRTGAPLRAGNTKRAAAGTPRPPVWTKPSGDCSTILEVQTKP